LLINIPLSEASDDVRFDVDRVRLATAEVCLIFDASYRINIHLEKEATR
jgi:hypothetical protein